MSHHGAHLHSVVGVADGARGGRRGHAEGFVPLESVQQQTVDGTVVIVRIRVQ